ncbi:hypothetical protein GCM10009850_105780 [Nonomuraea monospora]|uniref:SdpI family protein n=1 Tax=Nonomuraea monospora TaxID=568818 RepID=A0ABN3D004_9ACTN
MEALPLVLALAGLVLTLLGFFGRIGWLPRNNVAGVRTRSTMRSDAAFRVANRAAGVPTMAGGGVVLAGAVVMWLMLGATAGSRWHSSPSGA